MEERELQFLEAEDYWCRNVHFSINAPLSLKYAAYLVLRFSHLYNSILYLRFCFLLYMFLIRNEFYLTTNL